MTIRYADLRPKLSALGIRRPALAQLLCDGARAAGAALHFGSGVEQIRETSTHVSLLAGDAEHGPFDVVLVCDGWASRLRGSVLAGARVRMNPLGVYSVVAPLPSGVPADTLHQRLDGLRDGVGLLSIGHAGGTTPLVSFFWNVRTARRAQLEAAGYGAWCAYIESFCPDASGFLRSLGGFDALTFSMTAEVALRRWHTGRTVVIGDAAHALNPQLGLGATMALLDAQCLAQALRVSAAGIPDALTAYQCLRAPHVRRYARVSRFWSALDAAGFSPLRRRLFMAVANGPAAVRRRLLRHVCGEA